MTKEELKQLNGILKEIPKEKRANVRRMISADIPFDDAMTVCRAFLPVEAIKPRKTSNKGVKIQNKTLDDKQPDIVPPTDQNDENSLSRVEDAGKPTFEEITLKVYEAISQYCVLHDMENIDLIKAPQRIFGAVSSYVGENVFKNTHYFKSNVLKQAVGQAYPTTNGAYDVEKIAKGIKLYSKICNEYNKAFLIDYVAYFLGVSDDYLYGIREKLTPYGIDLQKKREASLTASLVDGMKNPTGTLATLNHFHGWTTGASHTEKKETIVMYPVLGNITSNNTPMIENN